MPNWLKWVIVAVVALALSLGWSLFADAVFESSDITTIVSMIGGAAIGVAAAQVGFLWTDTF